MKIKLNNDIIFQTTDGAIKLPINLDIANGGSLWIGNVKNGFDLEDLIPKSKGSINFLFDDNITFLFSKITNILNVMMFNFPSRSIIKDNISEPSFESISKGTIIYDQNNNFSLETPLGMYYSKKYDALIFYYNDVFFDFEKYNKADIVENFSFILDDNIEFVGFILENPTLYIQDIEPSINKSDLINVFLIYLSLINQDTTEKMDDGDIVLKEELFHLTQEIHIQTFNRVFKDLYEVYYR